MCTQNYPSSQFVSGNGPRYQVCVRCAVENGRRYRLWFFIGAGWLLYLTLGNDIELWSNVFLVALVIGTLATPVLHLLGSAQFKAELAKLTP